MASLTISTAFLATSAAATRSLPTTTARRGVVKASAYSRPKMVVESESESNNTRRSVMVAMAAAAVSAVAGVAVAEEPKRGSSEAKKKYGPICVTMPTARVCHY